MNTKELRLQIGKNARQCRKELGYTQEVLAEKCGFTAPYCSQIETGARLLSLPKFITLVEALDTTPTVLVYGKSKNERIERIAKILSDMPESDVAYVEEMIILAKDWLNTK